MHACASVRAVAGPFYPDQRRAEVERTARARLGLLASGCAGAVAAWRNGLARQPDAIVNSDVIRLFMREAASATDGADLPFPTEHPDIVLEGMKAVANDVTGTAYRNSQLGLGDVKMAGKTGTAQARTYRAAASRRDGCSVHSCSASSPLSAWPPGSTSATSLSNGAPRATWWTVQSSRCGQIWKRSCSTRRFGTRCSRSCKSPRPIRA